MSLTFKFQALMNLPVSMRMKRQAMGLSVADLLDVEQSIYRESLFQKREHDFKQWKEQWSVRGKFSQDRFVELCYFSAGLVAGYFLF